MTSFVPPIVAAAIAFVVLAVAAARFRIVRARRTVDAPVTEAQARDHASPLTSSILSVGPRPSDRGGFES